MMTGKWIAQSIGTVVELRIPDFIGKGAKPVVEIARHAGASEDAVYRLLRALASVGVFAETSGRRFKLTAIGQHLRSDVPESLAGVVRFSAHDSTWRPWGHLAYSVKTAKPAFDEVFGMNIFDYLPKNTAVAAIFDTAMTSLSTMDAAAVAAAYEFKNVGKLLDVAGGHGLLLATLLKKYPKMNGILFDLPHVVLGATPTFSKAGVSDRVWVTSGDFFKELPSGADVIMMKHIIHDWDDESCTKILQSCHRALPPKGKLLIIDAVIPPGNTPHFGKLLDLEMLVFTQGGRERTKQEFVKLLSGSGFRMTRIIPTHGPMSIVEAVKA